MCVSAALILLESASIAALPSGVLADAQLRQSDNCFLYRAIWASMPAVDVPVTGPMPGVGDEPIADNMQVPLLMNEMLSVSSGLAGKSLMRQARLLAPGLN